MAKTLACFLIILFDLTFIFFYFLMVLVLVSDNTPDVTFNKRDNIIR